MTPSHYLRPLLMPASVALVGASGRPGSMGRILMENLLGGDFHGALFAVNPNHRRVLAQRSYPSLGAIGMPVELALIAVPAAKVVEVIDGSARAGTKAAVVFSAPPADPDEARNWYRKLLATAAARGVRVLGPHSFGVIRTDIGLNATLGTTAARRGRLALLAQSGAVSTAMLDFAASSGIGFSTVATLGAAIDTGFGELLDALVHDAETDGILLYGESVGDARRFLSALRAAARAKPVVVLKAGRSMERGEIDGPTPDAVFDAAMRRAGTVRVKTYTQLFAAARILAMNRISRGDRLAIVTNGHGPGTLAADIAADRGIVLAEFSPATRSALAGILPPNTTCRNPLNLRGDATPRRIASAVEAALSDQGVDAVLALHVERPASGATDAARAVAAVARRAAKPVLGGWLGSIDRREVDAALEAGGVANFFTPENGVEAFSFLSAYRHNQEWLLEVPPPQPEPRAPDLRSVERIRVDAAATDRRTLTEIETQTVLATFGLPVAPALSADTLSEALAAGRRLGYPVSIRTDAPAAGAETPAPILYDWLRDGRMLTRAWAQVLGGAAQARRRAPVVVRRSRPFDASTVAAVGVHVDAVFGPVITLGAGRAARAHPGAQVVMLPPLNDRLAGDLVRASRMAVPERDAGEERGATEALTRILVQVSALACAVPWLSSLALDPVRIGGGRVEIGGARIEIDPRPRPPDRPYGHMAIHPYPIEKVADVVLPDGGRLHVRPIRPEDAELERAFVSGLSEQTRYFRFFYQLHELTPAMVARFTQVDYDREMALVAVDESVASPAIVGVGRYIESDPDGAEFALVVADAWQRRGVGRMLMVRLVDCAKGRGLKRLEGAVLRGNANMLKFVAAFGFAIRDDPDDGDQVVVTLDL
ncbi:MAG: GNAT family N-acetyltransferase [Betaproteobacteria bacterium]